MLMRPGFESCPGHQISLVIPTCYGSARDFRRLTAPRPCTIVVWRLLLHDLPRTVLARVVTPVKARNYLQAQRDMRARAVRVRSLPWILNLDTFSGCNLGCPFCPTGTNQHDRRKARMPIETAKRVIDKVKDHVLVVKLYNWGEPFLNPDIFEIIRYAHDAGMFTEINSNLSLRVPDLPQRVVDAKLDQLQVSVDGVSQRTLEIYRRRASAATVFENVRAIAEERKRRGVEHPRIELAFLVFRHNEHEIPLLESKRREIGADSFTPRPAFIYHESFVPENPDFQPVQTLFHGTCNFLYSELTVEATGTVSPCCTNTSEKWDLGEVDEIEDLWELWNGPTYRAMRALHAGTELEQTPQVRTLCHTCDLVKHLGAATGPLSPLPPGFNAEGIRYRHGLDGRGPAI